MPGTCLGLVLPRERANDPETDRSFIKPRTILQVAEAEEDEFLIIDMGGWKANNGRLFWMKKFNGEFFETKSLNMVSILLMAFAIQGMVIITSEKSRIIRFKFIDGKMEDIQTVIDDLPSFEGHMHPLTQFVFDPSNMDLFINSGPPVIIMWVARVTHKSCPEEFTEGLGAIYRVPGQFIKNLVLSASH